MNSRHVLVVSPHSFVDLITNSSTELYVCDTKKSIEAVKELLGTLLVNHDKIEGTTHTFEEVFGSIHASPFTFQWWDVPQEVQEQYQFYEDYKHYGRLPGDIFYGNEDNTEKKALQEEDRKIARKLNVHERGLYERDEAEYNRRWNEYRSEADVLWTPYGAAKLKASNNLFFEFLKQNNFTPEQIALAKVQCDLAVEKYKMETRGQSGWGNDIKFPTEELTQAFEVFREWASWGITAKKGDIFIFSASDNTIPYEMMDTISSYLNADRYHLG